MAAAKDRNLLTVTIGALIAILAFAVGDSRAQEWETFTSFTDVRRFTQVGDSLFAVTSGGLLAITDRDQPGQTYVNLDGLGTNDLTDLLVDADGQRWVSGAGRLVRFGGDNPRQFPTAPVYGNLRLLTLEDDGDYLWIGSDSGLVLFSKVNDGGQFQNRYRITSVNQFPAVNDIALHGDSIWLATAAGVAVADRSDLTQLVSPANWTVYSTATHPVLGSDAINRVMFFEGQLYLGGSDGLFLLSETGGTVTITANPVVSDVAIADLVMQNDSLFIYSARGIAAAESGTVSLLPAGPFSSIPVTGFNTGSVRWIALEEGGLLHDATGSFEPYPYIGMPENVVADITVSADGIVIALFDTEAAARLVDGQWQQIVFDVGGRATKIRTDSSGAIWAGTFGEGAYRIVGDDLLQFDQQNAPLHIDGNGDVVISAIATSPDHVFLASLNPVQGYPIAYCDIDSVETRAAWDSIGSADGLTDNTIISLAFQGSRLAIGSDNNGVFVCEPFRGIDDCGHFTEDDNRLVSDVVRVVRFAPDGALWVGTNFGLSREAIELGLPLFETIELPPGIGPDITGLQFDGRGNAWIGARNGLAFYDATEESFTIFTSSNSGLVDNEVRGLAIDPTSGDLYVATNFGLSRYPSLSGPPTSELDDVIAFPNPFVIESDDDVLRFNFDRPGDVRIFSTAGDFVDEFPVNEGWDGRNTQGKDVASGVYLFLITDSNGDVGRGKILLVRQ
ncbi:hypothetical protein GF420_04960 [candidate division GN15 bacterium]|nr:hypothetical protein [candidate division GN15 bacterium]